MNSGPDMVLIDAVYINTGGGNVLLLEFLAALRGTTDVALVLDSRLVGFDVSGFTTFVVAPGEVSRARFYTQHGKRLERVLCFGNVPPPIRLEADVAVYFHNMLLCEPIAEIGQRRRWLASLKMAYIRFMSRNADRFLVQSPVVRSALARRLPSVAEIIEVPFYPSRSPSAGDGADPQERWNRYAYVSNAYLHKNHGVLLDAWERLACRGIYPELHLTISGDHPQLYAKIERVRARGGLVVNHGFTEASTVYRACGYQIYPSLAESFGLALVEAAEAGCAILASDRPFVRQVVNPLATFDPNSASAIEEVVLRTYGKHASASEVVVPNQLSRLTNWVRNGSWAELA